MFPKSKYHGCSQELDVVMNHNLFLDVLAVLDLFLCLEVYGPRLGKFHKCYLNLNQAVLCWRCLLVLHFQLL